MKILHIRFQNLNSLVGEWHIDFTHPAFVADGIFAITGPTGAGKTTVLDAICLALFGRTPRLSRISRAENEIMSRGTGECFAEVVFETQKGRWCCHWSQRRARKKADGELQAPKHEISDAVSGAVFESGIRGVAEQVEDATGMDFDRFTRSMLLAQGAFAAFLQAGAGERSPILEQITGTEIYSAISVKVHELRAQEQEKLKECEAALDGVRVLSREEEQEHMLDMARKEQEVAACEAESLHIRKLMDWRIGIRDLAKDMAALTGQEAALEKEFLLFAPERQRLAHAVRAAALDGSYEALAAVRQEQKKEENALVAARHSLPELELLLQEEAGRAEDAARASLLRRQERDAAAPVWRQARAIDQKIAASAKDLDALRGDCRLDGRAIAADRRERTKTRESLNTALHKRGQIAAYLAEHAADQWLVGGLAGVEEQLKELAAAQAELARKEAERRKAATDVRQAAAALADIGREALDCGQKAQAAEENLARERAALEAVLRQRSVQEYRNEKDVLLRQLAAFRNIAALAGHRARLEDGKPCPLCGAEQHPYAQGNVPSPDAAEQKIEALSSLIRRAEELEGLAALREKERDEARKARERAERRQESARQDAAHAEKMLALLTENLSGLQNALALRQQSVAEKLRPLGLETLPADIARLSAELARRLEAWQTGTGRKDAVEQQIAGLESEDKRLTAVLENRFSALKKKCARLRTGKEELAGFRAQRALLCGAKDPDAEERRLQEAVDAADRAEKQARAAHAEREKTVHAVTSRVSALQESMALRARELERLQAAFITALTGAEFAEEKDFLEARLPLDARHKLEETARSLDARALALRARKEDRLQRLRVEEEKNLTEDSLEDLEARHAANREKLNALTAAVAAVKLRLEENTAARAARAEKLAAVDAQKKECARWNRLHELVGSADGKKYRNFVQGLTFAWMIAHANEQLRELTDRYILLRHPTLPLELEIMDNYQGGEVRSTKNLSGGESFVVSLALALGLCRMAGNNVRVDSLFLDEGFGTLDEDALDTALQTLAGLRQDGKVIGVISHVPALTEQIPTQIWIMPQSGGRSRIFGPGCSSSGQ